MNRIREMLESVGEFIAFMSIMLCLGGPRLGMGASMLLAKLTDTYGFMFTLKVVILPACACFGVFVGFTVLCGFLTRHSGASILIDTTNSNSTYAMIDTNAENVPDLHFEISVTPPDWPQG